MNNKIWKVPDSLGGMSWRDDKWAGWGWMQTCTVATGRVNIECVQQPALGNDRCMRLCLIALDQTNFDRIYGHRLRAPASMWPDFHSMLSSTGCGKSHQLQSIWPHRNC